MPLPEVCYTICLMLVALYVVTDGFDLGSGMISLFLREEYEKSGLFRAVGPVWNTNVIWLAAALAFLFSAFAPAFVLILNSQYIIVILLFTGLVLRAVSAGFREKAGWEWKKTVDTLFGIGSLTAVLCVGIICGNLIKGLPVAADGSVHGGPFLWLNTHSLFFGLLFTVFCCQHGILFLITRTGEPLTEKLKKVYPWFALAYILLLAAAILMVRSSSLFADHAGPMKPLTMITLCAAGLGIILCPFFAFADLHEVSFGLSTAAVFCLAGTAVLAVYPVIVSSTLAASYNVTALNASNPAGLHMSLVITLAGMPVVLFCKYLLYRIFGKTE